MLAELNLDRLSVDDRLDLIGELWDSLENDAPPLTDAQRADLELRLAEHARNPQACRPWAEVKARLLGAP